MTGLSEMPKLRDIPKRRLSNYTMEDGTKVVLRDFSDSAKTMGPHWTIEFFNIPTLKVSRLEIKMVIENGQ